MHEKRSMNMRTEGTYDYIIIDAGSAGCVMALRLGEDHGVRILVLDNYRDRYFMAIIEPDLFAVIIDFCLLHPGYSK